MTGFAYPEMLVEVVRLHQNGEIDRAEDLFDTYLPLVRYEQQPGFGLALRKEILHRRGVITSPKVRSPGPILTDTDQLELTRLIKRVDKKLKDQ
jgi:4-hydroxy-tetrahydrodipicolinate synthase